MPLRASFAEAASVALAGSTAIQAFRDVARLRSGDRVLVHGASGGVGSLAIQLAKAAGAHVTATAGAPRLGRCLALGADQAFDHATGEALRGERRYRVVFDVFGNLPLDRARPVLDRGGVLVTTVPSWRIAIDTLRTLAGPVRARMVSVRPRTVDLAELARRLDDGTLRPQLDRVFPFAEAPEAVRWVEERRAHGKVVVTID
jgi:NADPH:quinone reductase-like Zn-dependent oxidoreductase